MPLGAPAELQASLEEHEICPELMRRDWLTDKPRKWDLARERNELKWKRKYVVSSPLQFDSLERDRWGGRSRSESACAFVPKASDMKYIVAAYRTWFCDFETFLTMTTSHTDRKAQEIPWMTKTELAYREVTSGLGIKINIHYRLCY